MPELAEVEYYRRKWDPGLGGRVQEVLVTPRARVFRQVDLDSMRRSLTGSLMKDSQARGKQMLFRFTQDSWLGIHLGMTGKLRVEGAGARPGRHDHLLLRQSGRSLIFQDARLFGLVRFHRGRSEPDWWLSLPPEILSNEFTLSLMAGFLRRRANSPIKAVLLMQERFPGIGNWMADEVLWRSGIHPARKAGSLSAGETARLWRALRAVSRTAMKIIGPSWGDLPRDWLFHRRWEDGQLCPRTGLPLVRERIGGRTTCWSPGRQPRP